MEATVRPHKHIILDGLVTRPPSNEKEIIKFLAKIITDIGMVVAELSPQHNWLGKLFRLRQPNPIAWYCADPNNRGLTAGGILTTSHIVMHVWDKPDPAPFHFDLYSCSDFNEKDIVRMLHDKFNIIECRVLIIDRENSDVPIQNFKWKKK